jgi:hypothetical protein
LRDPRHGAVNGLLRFAGNGDADVDGAVFGWPQMSATARRARGTAATKVSCEDCYFKCNMLCALQLAEPCATFRPDSPEGLRPPSQLRFVFRQERRTQAAWAFPSAQEQAALHA